jgi:hypothetical protein
MAAAAAQAPGAAVAVLTRRFVRVPFTTFTRHGDVDDTRLVHPAAKSQRDPSPVTRCEKARASRQPDLQLCCNIYNGEGKVRIAEHTGTYTMDMRGVSLHDGCGVLAA